MHGKNIFEAKYKTRGFINLTFIDYVLYFTRFYNAEIIEKQLEERQVQNHENDSKL